MPPSIWRAKGEASGEGGGRWDPPLWTTPGDQMEGGCGISSRALGGNGEASSPRYMELIVLNSGMRCFKTLDSISRACPSPILTQPRAGALRTPRPHFLLSAKGGGGKELETKRTRDRYLPARERRETATAVCACAQRLCGSMTAGRSSCNPWSFLLGKSKR